ncbi:MAG: hypothetical protein AAF202_00280, partial [Pseudomonadota bacterium]
HAFLAVHHSQPFASLESVQIFETEMLYGSSNSDSESPSIARDVARYSTRAALHAYRNRKLIPMLVRFRGYLKGVLMASSYVLEDAYRCTESMSELMTAECHENFHEFLDKKLIPGFKRARQLAALQESGRWLMYSMEYTETPSVLSNIRAKMNPERTNHPFYFFSDFGPDGIRDDLEVKDLQPLSAEEIVGALVRFKQDGQVHESEMNYDEMMAERMDYLLESRPHIRDEQFLIDRYERQFDRDVQSLIARHVFMGRQDEDRPQYDKEYKELLQEFPTIAFLQMPLDDNVDDNSRSYVKDLLCSEDELQRDRALLWGEDPVDAMFGGTCRSEDVPNNWAMRYLANRNRYKTDLEGFLEELHIAIGIQLEYVEQIWQAPYHDEEEDFDELIWLLSYDQAFEYFAEDTAPPEEEEEEAEEEASVVIRKTDRIPAQQGARTGSVQTHQFDFMGTEREVHFAMYEYLKERYESKVFWRDMREVGLALGLGIACALLLSRLKPVTAIASRLATLVGWKRIAAIASCYLIPGLAVNLGFVAVAKNKYLQNFRKFVASVGNLEINGEVPDGLSTEEGRIQSRLLLSLDRVIEHDQAIRWEYAFFLIGTGVGDTVKLILRGN